MWKVEETGHSSSDHEDHHECLQSEIEQAYRFTRLRDHWTSNWHLYHFMAFAWLVCVGLNLWVQYGEADSRSVSAWCLPPPHCDTPYGAPHGASCRVIKWTNIPETPDATKTLTATSNGTGGAFPAKATGYCAPGDCFAYTMESWDYVKLTGFNFVGMVSPAIPPACGVTTLPC